MPIQRNKWNTGNLGPKALGVLLTLMLPGRLTAQSDPANVKPHSLAVLEPVDLQNGKGSPLWGGIMRGKFNESTAWALMPPDSMVLKLEEYGIDGSKPCHEFQCAFDMGNVLQVEFISFGSVTRVGETYAFTLNLLHLPTSQVVWSRAGEARRGPGSDPGEVLAGALSRLLGAADPHKLEIARKEKRGLLSVLDLSPGSDASRVVSERVTTHLLASRQYDVMGQGEMRELMAGLDIKKPSALSGDSALFSLGEKMGVSHLVYSRLSEGPPYLLRLAIFDIKSREKVREWPSPRMDDFQKVLQFESDFISSLFPPKGGAMASRPAVSPRAKLRLAKLGAGLGLAVSATLGVLAYSSWRQANEDYSRFRASLSQTTAEVHRKRVESEDRDALIYGALAGVGLAGAGVLTFAF